jgi:hypothetical protein
MDAIRAYIENVFLNITHSDAARKLKEDMLANMEEKYEELKAAGKSENEAVGTVIAEFGNADELFEELGLASGGSDGEAPVPEIGVVEYESYKSELKKRSSGIGGGVATILTGIAVMLFIGSGAENGSMQPTQQDLLWTIGVIVMLCFVAAGVGLLIYNGMLLKKYEFFEDGRFRLNSAFRTMLQDEMVRAEKKLAFATAIGVGFILLGVIVVIFSSMFDTWKGDMVPVIGTGILILLVAAGVYTLITSSMRHSVYEKLLKIGEYSEKSKAESKAIEKFAGFYWPVIVAIYLGWSFISMDWHLTWVIWPVAGLLFAGLTSLIGKSQKS